MPRKSIKRRRGGRKKQRLSVAAVSKAICPLRKYLYEERDNLLSTTSNNTIKWGYLGISHNSRAAFPTPATIVTQAGQDASPFVTTDKNYKVRIVQQQALHNLRNVSNQPCYLTLYTVMCIKDIEYDSGGFLTTVGRGVLTSLIEGWDVDMQTAQVDFSGTGSIVNYLSGGTEATSTSSLLSLKHSRQFMAHFKVVKSKMFKLNPGDDVMWPVSCPSYTISGDDLMSGGATEQRPVCEANKTVAVLYRLHGALGKQLVDNTKIGYMQADVAVASFFRAKYYRLGVYDSTLAMANVTTDTLTAALVGPSDYAEVEQS